MKFKKKTKELLEKKIKKISVILRNTFFNILKMETLKIKPQRKKL